MTRSAYAALLLLGGACAAQAPPGGAPQGAPPDPLTLPPPGLRRSAMAPDADPLPEVPAVVGPLAIRVAYPGPGDRVAAGDSSFIFGSVGDGAAALRINGQAVPVWPNGAWLAWIAFPPDSLMRFDLEATRGPDSARLTHLVPRVRRFTPPPTPAWVDPESLRPGGRVWWPAGEPIRLTLRAAEGAEVRLLLPGGEPLRFAPDPAPAPVAEGLQAFDRDPGTFDRPLRADRYAAVLLPRRLGPDPGPLLPGPAPAPGDCAPPGPADSLAILEVISGGDTSRMRWPLRLAPLAGPPAVAGLDDGREGGAGADGITVGRAVPGGSYHWFFPRGTRAQVTGRVDDDLRLRLSATSDAWVAAAEAAGLPPGAAVRGRVGSISPAATSGGVRFRIPVGVQVPYRVVEEARRLTLTLHGAVGDVNWIRHGATDDVVAGIRWEQRTADEVDLVLDLREPLWGYRVGWDRGDLLLEVRRPPRLDRTHPLRGLLVALDPGHPPGGATGPTGLREAEANLGIARELGTMLEAEGARVHYTRTGDAPLGLAERIASAEAVDAAVLISIHNNALPDGVDPFRNNGTSVFYHQPRSRALAREVQRALVRRLGLRDLGYARGDLALVRPTWVPSILTEGMFLMLPDQEHALRTTEGRRRYARGVAEGLAAFLRERAGSS